ncbi:MAG TPA: c-type cytochrome domain-containing protein, partial [Terriglobia bacterium]|nr:c-type cytochrome domain-containing protein [Terriglobia bacterium]
MRPLPVLQNARRQGQNSVLISSLILSGIFAAGILVGRERQSPASPGQGDEKVDFKRDIKPIFDSRCIKCHGADKPQAELRLDSEAGVLRGSISGRVVVPGKGAESLLVKRLSGFNGVPPMPLGSDPLSPKQIDIIRAWIDQMAPPKPPQAPAPGDDSGQTTVTGEILPGSREGGRDTKTIDFATRIQPIFDDNCVRCHGSSVQQNQLRLDSLAGLMQGSLHGRVVVPGNSKDSPLLRRLLGLDEPRMPFGSAPLEAEKIDLIRSWIDQGAPGAPAPEARPGGQGTASAHRAATTHWAFVTPIRPALPEVKHKAWVRNPIDNFVLAKLEPMGLLPSPEAD